MVYYSSYYRQPSQPQTQQQPYSQYQTSQRNPPAPHGHARTASPNNSYHPYQQSHDQQPNYRGAPNWYGQADQSLGRAAETLSAMGSTAPRQTAVTSPSVPPQTQYAPTPYSAAEAAQPPVANFAASSTNTYQYHAASSNVTSLQIQGRRAARPDSVNSNRTSASSSMPSPAIQPTPSATPQYPSMIQRSASPAQIQAAHNLTAASQRPAATSTHRDSNAHHRTNFSRAQTHSVQGSNSPYSNQTPAPLQSPSIRAYNNNPSPQSETAQTVTVDPSQVYDPWPEYQRRKAAEDAQRAKRQAAEAELRQQAEQAERREAERREVERPKAEKRKEERQREVEEAGASKPSSLANKASTKSRAPKYDGQTKKTGNVEKPAATKLANEEDEGDEDAKMLAMFKAMKAKNPTMFQKLMADAEAGDGAPAARSTEMPTTKPKQQRALPGVQSGISDPKPGISIPTIALEEPPATITRDSRGADVGTSLVSGTSSTTNATALHRTTTGSPNSHDSGNTKALDGKQTTFWPPEKKHQLGKAAADFLNNTRENQNNQIDPTSIVAIFDTNPSYIALCEQLEGHGLKIDRAQFARALLTAVPDVNAAAKRQREGKQKVGKQNNKQILDSICDTSNTASSTIPTPKNQAHTFQMHQYVDGSWTHVKNAQHHESRSRESPHLADQPQQISPSSSLKPAAVSSSGSVPPVKHVGPRLGSADKPINKADAARKRGFAELVDLTQLSDDDEPVSKRHNFGTLPPPYGMPTGQGYSRSFSFNPKPLPSQARYQSSYIQPRGFQPGLNHASQHMSQATQPSGPTANSRLSGTVLVEPIERRKALRRSSYDVRTIARDVLLATGRHPDMFGLNSHLEALKTHLPQIGNLADLSTLRWDLIDPGDPLPLEQVEDDQDSVQGDADDEEEQQQPEPRRTIVRSSINGNRKPIVKGHSTHDKSHARRSRPTRAGPFPSFSTRDRKEQAGTDSDLHSSALRPSSLPNAGKQQSTPTNKNRAMSHNTPGSSGGTSYVALWDAAGSGVKRRGRPFGWRKAIHMKGGPGGPPAAPVGKQPSPEAEYAVYTCKWKDCSAELHNLLTLRKHVQKLHQKHSANGGYDCLWEGCSHVSEGERQRLHFSTQPQWWTHLEEAHFSKIAWKLGDGPSSGLSEAHDSDHSEAYLSDAHGRRVTPRVKTPPFANDNQDKPLSNGGQHMPSASRIGRPPQEQGVKRLKKALETEDAMRRKREQLGFGLDRGGSTLANAKRRQGFIDDEDFEEIVEDD